jgi:hypothetical protein
MAVNNRVYYAIQQVAMAPDDSAPGQSLKMKVVHGVQSVGITTTFNLEQVFELGQISIYENVEGTPDVEVTMSKVLDGYIPLYCMATAMYSSSPALANRNAANVKSFVQLGIWNEANNQSAGQTDTKADSMVEMSGLVVSSVGYNFPLDDNFSEDVTMVGNYKVWKSGTATNTISTGCGVTYYPTGVGANISGIDGGFASNDDAPIGDGGVNRRENIQFALTSANASGADYTIIPKDIPGVLASGVKGTNARISSITASVDLGREDIFELGSKLPYAKTVSFPVEVTCDFEVTTVSGDLINALDDCTDTGACNTKQNLNERPIRVATCEGLRLWLGKKNKLSSVTYGGGDAGGGNATVTYSYSNFNDFTVMHSGDVEGNGGHVGGDTVWDDREVYIGTGVW